MKNTQKELSVEFLKLIESGSFPNCVMFAGPRYSGRLFAANTVSKALGCSFESTLFLSDRNFRQDIFAAIKLFKNNRNKSSAELLHYSLSMHLKQFHIVFLDSKSREKKFSDAAALMEMTDEILKLREEEVPLYLDKLEKNLSAFFTSANSQVLTVNKISAIKRWCYEYSPDGKVKTVILEGFETAGETVTDALLKILEEPPVDTYFIILSSNYKRIPGTVLSRLRIFNFNEINNDGLKYLFDKWNVDSTKYTDLKSFFIDNSGVNIELIDKNTELLIDGKEPDLPELYDELEKTQSYSYFYEKLIIKLKEKNFELNLNEKKCSVFLKELQEHINKANSFNQNAILNLEFVVFKTMEFFQ